MMGQGATHSPLPASAPTPVGVAILPTPAHLVFGRGAEVSVGGEHLLPPDRPLDQGVCTSLGPTVKMQTAGKRQSGGWTGCFAHSGKRTLWADRFLWASESSIPLYTGTVSCVQRNTGPGQPASGCPQGLDLGRPPQNLVQ